MKLTVENFLMIALHMREALPQLRIKVFTTETQRRPNEQKDPLKIFLCASVVKSF
jgi:hypothetical protein